LMVPFVGLNTIYSVYCMEHDCIKFKSVTSLPLAHSKLPNFKFKENTKCEFMLAK